MRGLSRASLPLLGLLLAWLLFAEASAVTPIDFDSTVKGPCALGIIDDPEPLPTGFRRWINEGGLIELNDETDEDRCPSAISLPVVLWSRESAVEPGTMVLSYLMDGTWSESQISAASSSAGATVPATPKETIHLLRGSSVGQAAPVAAINGVAGSHTARAPSRLARYQRSHGAPSLLFNPVSNLSIAAWTSESSEGLDIVMSFFAGGVWSAPEVIAGSSENEMDPHLVAGLDGAVHLFYTSSGGTPRILHRQATADLSSWTSPTQVSLPGEGALRPHAVLHLGALHVVYESYPLGLREAPRNVLHAWLSDGEFVSEVLALARGTGDIQPQVHSEAGHLWVDWIDAANEMARTRMGAEGRWTPGRDDLPLARRGHQLRRGHRLP